MINRQNKVPTAYQPRAEQILRAKATRRFTRLYVYLPLGFLAAVILIFSLYLLYIAIFPPNADTRIFLSGLADFILIVWLIPTTLIFGLVMTAAIGGYLYYKYGMDDEQKPLPPAPPYGRLRTFLWRSEAVLIQLIPKLVEAENKVARPVIQLNAIIAYIESWLINIKNFILRR